jgi:phytoene dehydrogenase-like protein
VSETFDVAILGSSPNALVAAARLAGAGRRVVVLDEARAPGGPVVTEELAPGFFADTGVMSAALDGEVVRALGAMGPQAAPNPGAPKRASLDGAASGPKPRRAERARARHRSGGDLARHGDGAHGEGGPRTWAVSGESGGLPFLGLPAAARDAVEVLRAVYSTVPPNMPVAGAEGAAALAEIGARLTGLGGRRMREVLRALFMSARDFLGETVADPVERGVLAGAAVRAMSAGPFAAGTLFGLLHHEAIGDGLRRSTARGGLSGMVAALLGRARTLGVEVRSGVTGPLAVDVEDGVARGVRLGDGSRIGAGVVVSDFDARATFTRLVPPYELEPEVGRAIRSGRYRGSVARVSLGASRTARVRWGGCGGAPRDAGRGAGRDPAGEGLGSGQARAAPGPAVCRGGDPDGGRSGPRAGGETRAVGVGAVGAPRGGRAGCRGAVIDRLASFAPGLRGLVEHVRVSLPEDLERQFGLTEGHLYGGEVSLAQAFFLRPVPGFSGYESPIGNLYLGGSAAHPGGYSGRSGWSLAGRLLDRGRQAGA